MWSRCVGVMDEADRLLAGIDPATAADNLFIRVERQTVRKAPKTGAVLFTIRIWRHPLSALQEDPVRLAAFVSASSSQLPPARECV